MTKLFLLQQHTFLHRAKKTEFDFDMTLTSSDLDLEITFNILRKLQGNTTIISQNDVKYYISACLMLVFKFDLDLVMTYLHEQDEVPISSGSKSFSDITLQGQFSQIPVLHVLSAQWTLRPLMINNIMP